MKFTSRLGWNVVDVASGNNFFAPLAYTDIRSAPTKILWSVNTRSSATSPLTQTAWRRKVKMPQVPTARQYALMAFVGGGTEIPQFKDLSLVGNKKMSVAAALRSQRLACTSRLQRVLRSNRPSWSVGTLTLTPCRRSVGRPSRAVVRETTISLL